MGDVIAALDMLDKEQQQKLVFEMNQSGIGSLSSEDGFAIMPFHGPRLLQIALHQGQRQGMENTKSIYIGLNMLVEILTSARRTLHSTSLFKDGAGIVGDGGRAGVYVVKVTGLANSALLENSLQTGDPIEFS